jgi:hypothetical protein
VQFDGPKKLSKVPCIPSHDHSVFGQASFEHRSVALAPATDIERMNRLVLGSADARATVIGIRQ